MKRNSPDDRLDWRNPDMPVYKLVQGKYVEIDPSERQRISKIKMNSDLPEWQEDETYNLKVDKC